MPTHCRRELTAGVALFRDGQLEEAEKRLLRAASQPSRFAFMNGGTSSDKATVIDAKFALAQIYKTWGSFEKAAQLLGEVHKANQIMLGETASATLLALGTRGGPLSRRPSEGSAPTHARAHAVLLCSAGRHEP